MGSQLAFVVRIHQLERQGNNATLKVDLFFVVTTTVFCQDG